MRRGENTIHCFAGCMGTKRPAGVGWGQVMLVNRAPECRRKPVAGSLAAAEPLPYLEVTAVQIIRGARLRPVCGRFFEDFKFPGPRYIAVDHQLKAKISLKDDAGNQTWIKRLNSDRKTR